MSERRRGLAYGVLAYGLWGFAPVFWKQLAHVDAPELLAHRAVWGLGTFAALVAIAGQGGALVRALRDRRLVGLMFLSGALLALNWGIFVWAAIRGHLLEASLGYFINPLISVAIGTIFLREKLTRLQWIAIGLAAVGVGILTWRAGRVPYISLLLAITFGLYGMIRKLATVDALVGSAIETALMVPIAIGYLIYDRAYGVLGHGSAMDHVLVVSTGVVTAIPLILFTSAARRLPLSTVGFLQYLAPTGQFLLAVLAYGEPLAHEKLVAFGFIWTALAVFSINLWRSASLTRAAAARGA
ncbi:MAG: EamA family transporter RarD [Kofleriaceae bacterium]